MVGIDRDGGPRSRSEAWSIIEVITAMVIVSVGKADLRPVALLEAWGHESVLENFVTLRNGGNVFRDFKIL